MQRSAVIYVRVSSAQQVGNFSLAAQEEACLAFCRGQGWPVARVFREEGESAKTADRTQLIALLDYCCDHKRDLCCVVVHSVSRWSRETSDHFNLKATLARLGIALRSATEPIDDSAEGGLMETILAGMSKFENQQRARRTVSGMRKALEGGRWVHRAPLGYLNGGRGKPHEPSLFPNPATAPLVRAAFEMFAEDGVSEAEVQRRLAKRGFTMPNGKPVSCQTVAKTLRNPAYAGRVRLASWGVDVPGDFEPIVSPALFDRVQARLAGNDSPKVHVRVHDDFPLRGLVNCGECGKPLTATWARGRNNVQYKTYWCYRCQRVGTKVRVSGLKLEGLFVDMLASLQPRPEYMRLFNAIVLDVWRNREATTRADRERLEQRVADLRKKRDRIQDALADGLLDAAGYRRQSDRLSRDLAVAEDTLGGTVVEHLDVERVLAFAEGVLCDASRLWERATADQRRRLQRTLFPKRVVYEPRDGGRLRTTVTCLAFTALGTPREAESTLVALRGFEPRFDG